MNNNDAMHPARQASGPNKYLQLARQTHVPLDIYFNDGEVIKSCIIMELDALNLLVKVIDLVKGVAGDEAVITRNSIKKIVTTAEASAHNITWSVNKPQTHMKIG